MCSMPWFGSAAINSVFTWTSSPSSSLLIWVLFNGNGAGGENPTFAQNLGSGRYSLARLWTVIDTLVAKTAWNELNANQMSRNIVARLKSYFFTTRVQLFAAAYLLHISRTFDFSDSAPPKIKTLLMNTVTGHLSWMRLMVLVHGMLNQHQHTYVDGHMLAN